MYRRIRIGKVPRPQALAVGLFARTTRLPGRLRALDRGTGGALAALLRRKEFTAERGSVTCLYPARGPQRLYVVGLGEKGSFDANVLRTAAAGALRAAFAARVTTLSVHLDPDGTAVAAPEAIRAVAEGLGLANFSFEAFKGAAEGAEHGAPRDLDLTVAAPPAWRDEARRGLLVAESANLARKLAATPPNIADPAHIAAFCRRMARQVGLRCTVVDAARAKRLGMGGLLAVGGGGSKPPCLVVLEWRGGRGAGPGGRGRPTPAPILLVGKTVTFDTGGYSLKPTDSMTRMKYDKCGGMAVIGALHAAARLKLRRRVVGILPVAENMISSRAYRVDDIVRFCNGVTAEITNTDAEGRLILADALAFGCRTYRPQAVIDLATLTGGVVVALGAYCAGLFCSHDGLRRRLVESGRFSGEKLWPLPLWEEHKAQIKGTHGDIVNAAGRDAHPIQGAAFLAHFVSADGRGNAFDAPPAGGWAHLDIAGVADVKKDTPLFATGPTGFGVRLLVRALETWEGAGGMGDAEC